MFTVSLIVVSLLNSELYKDRRLHDVIPHGVPSILDNLAPGKYQRTVKWISASYEPSAALNVGRPEFNRTNMVCPHGPSVKTHIEATTEGMRWFHSLGFLANCMCCGEAHGIDIE